MRQKNKHFRRGFTLVEALVSITILAMTIAFVLNVLTNSFLYARYAGDQVTATFLAEEGFELVENTRALNVQAGSFWLSSIPETGSKFTADPLDPRGTFTLCPGGVCPALNLDSSGDFTYHAGTPTYFYREISVMSVANDGIANEAAVTVTVYWPDSSRAHHVTFTNHIFSWNDFSH